jgi:pimeloyl-ACP methyl ester carboxylesterase
VERAVLVGHDLGGGVVQIAAVRAPQRCAGLVLTYGERLAWGLIPGRREHGCRGAGSNDGDAA